MKFGKKEPEVPAPDREAEIVRIRAEYDEKLEAADAMVRVARQSERLRCVGVVGGYALSVCDECCCVLGDIQAEILEQE